MASILLRIERYMRPAEAKLREKLEKNPYYPFTRIGPGVFKLTVRYRKLVLAVLGLVISILFIIIWSSSNLVSDNNLFLFPLFGAVISIASIYNYRSRRIYTLNLETLEYTFSHDTNLYTRGDFHNVYVRLKREARGGAAGGARSQRYYYLVFNGYQIDQRRISGSSTNVNEIRRLGQLIAANLNLNYFDENNSSEHHVVRHLRVPRVPGMMSRGAGGGMGGGMPMGDAGAALGPGRGISGIGLSSFFGKKDGGLSMGRL
ncbi:hypothetical protein H9P43_003440 [Blastocladiella emersonii ATCC 22665]|nr:hypothetical protein H9P43_003440 [Blastocladiella emersonii ATCC 22665]